MFRALPLLLAAVIALPAALGLAPAAGLSEDFESYATETALPAGWTYKYQIIQPKTPETESHGVVAGSDGNSYRIQLETVREQPSVGARSVANLLSPTMSPDMQPFSLDIRGSGFRGAGGESSAGAAVGYSVIYHTDNGTKAVSVRTHALNDKSVDFRIAYNGTHFRPDATLNDFGGPSGSLKTASNDAKTLYEANGLGDYDAEVNGWILALGGSSYTSQINGRTNGWTGQYDNVLVTSVLPDTTPPTITAPAGFVFEANGPLSHIDNATIGSANATDDRDPAPFVNGYAFAISKEGRMSAFVQNSSSFPLGTVVITWVAVDSSGNTAADTQIIRIQDTTPPAIAVPSDASFNATGNLTRLTADDYGAALAIDFVDPAPEVSSDAPELFPVSNTTITWTATDASGNSANATQTVTILPVVKPIRDAFENMTEWAVHKTATDYVPISGPDYDEFNNYSAQTASGDGNPSPSARISGDGFVAYSAIQRNVSLTDMLPRGDLYVGIDYKATSWTADSSVTNARIEILNSSGGVVYGHWLNRGGTVNTGWQSFSHNIGDAVWGLDSVTVRLGMNDGWIANWRQTASFDNFYMGAEPLPSLATEAVLLELTFPQRLSELIAAGNTTAACQALAGADSQQRSEVAQLPSYHNTTLSCP